MLLLSRQAMEEARSMAGAQVDAGCGVYGSVWSSCTAEAASSTAYPGREGVRGCI